MYYVIAQDGQRYGPVDLATLNQWATDNRVVPTTTLETDQGQRLEASTVPGIVFPAATAPNYGAPMGGNMGGAPGGYGAPETGAAGYAPYPHSQGMQFGDNGKKDVTISFIFSGINLLLGWFCCPLIFGTIAIVYGNNAKKKGHPQGNTAFILAIVLTCVLFGAALLMGVGGFMSAFREGMRGR